MATAAILFPLHARLSTSPPSERISHGREKGQSPVRLAVAFGLLQWPKAGGRSAAGSPRHLRFTASTYVADAAAGQAIVGLCYTTEYY
nr:unnamed protein product [Digitaria exilis]